MSSNQNLHGVPLPTSGIYADETVIPKVTMKFDGEAWKKRQHSIEAAADPASKRFRMYHGSASSLLQSGVPCECIY